MESDEKKLINELLDGKEEAFDVLVKKYLKPVYNFIYQLTRDRSVLDDMTQITFIKAWKNIGKFDQEKNFKTWLFAIAKNTALDHWKKKKTLPFSLFTDEEGNNKLENIDGDNPLPDEILDRENLAEELEKKLKELPHIYQTILLLHYKDDFSLQEISDILEKPYNTIKSQHNRALHHLKQALEK